MITASEAKELYDQSGAEVAGFLKGSVEPIVIETARGGKRVGYVLLGSLGWYDHLDQVVTPVGKAAVEKLVALGYTAKIVKYGESYVPRGLADDDGNGPFYTNYGIQIEW